MANKANRQTGSKTKPKSKPKPAPVKAKAPKGVYETLPGKGSKGAKR